MADDDRPPARDRSDLWLVRGLALLICLVFVGLGVLSIASGTYHARTTKLGGAEVVLHGRAALFGGGMYIALGLLPLALWFRTRRRAAWWAGACVALLAGFLAASLLARG